MRGLIMIGLALLDVSATILTMTWTTLDFIVNLKKPY
jgi:hypothetical protein